MILFLHEVSHSKAYALLHDDTFNDIKSQKLVLLSNLREKSKTTISH